MKKTYRIKFLGHYLGKEKFPVLYEWAKINPETLKKAILSLTKKEKYIWNTTVSL